MVHHVKSMGVSTTGALGSRSILCSQVLVLMWVSWAYFPSTVYLTCDTGLLAFQRQLLLEYGGGPEKDRNVCVFGGGSYALSPQIRLASWMSLGMMVTRRAWMAHKLVSSNNPTR